MPTINHPNVVCFNNCRGADHAAIFREGAFYDLFTTGVQTNKATNLPVGQLCVVAGKPSLGNIVFSWYRFLYEEVLPNPSDVLHPESRVFFGELQTSETIPRGEARQLTRYARFFNVNGDFKQVSAFDQELDASDLPVALQYQLASTRESVDLPAPPERIESTTYRILRDTELARRVKFLHRSKCQICDRTIELPDGKRYAEAHHIRPLGAPHNGPDVMGNIVCVCPNHHAELDYGVTAIAVSELRAAKGHVLDPAHVEYHNKRVLGQLPR